MCVDRSGSASRSGMRIRGHCKCRKVGEGERKDQVEMSGKYDGGSGVVLIALVLFRFLAGRLMSGERIDGYFVFNIGSVQDERPAARCIFTTVPSSGRRKWKIEDVY
jgi:hypothetical protein